MKTLHLNLKKEWFDMIASGQKKEEYRDLTNYWCKRIFGYSLLNGYTLEESKSVYDVLSQNKDLVKPAKDFDTITFSNGYAKDRRQVVVEFKGVSIGEGNILWGAILFKSYFVISLGEILEKNF